MEHAFRGVVSGGCIRDERELMLVVSHPHPDNDHGGGPGPVREWNHPVDDEAYRDLVDSGFDSDDEEASDFDPDDVTFEVGGYRHVAVRDAAGWTLEEVAEAGSMRWTRSLGRLPGRVLVLDGCLGLEGTRVLYAGGQSLWMHGEGGWREVHASSRGEVSFVRCFPSGEVVAGTTQGDIILGTAERCRVVARVGRIHSAERWGGELFVADEDNVYRVEAWGFERCAVPKESSVARGVPDVGRLVAGSDRLWLAGSHVLASSADGKRWTTHPVR